jgi:hypothetical protein
LSVAIDRAKKIEEDEIFSSRPGQTGNSGRKRHYVRSTPIGRAVNNLAKMEKVGRLTLDRLRSWGENSNEDLAMAVRWLQQSLDATAEAASRMNILARNDWSPQRKSSSVSFEESEEVKISPKFRDRYLDVYGPKIVDDLVVSKVLPSGKIAVRHGRATPFIVAKSHLMLRRAEEDE